MTPMLRNSPTQHEINWGNRITGTPAMLTEKISVPGSMRDAPNYTHNSMIKVGDWNSPAVVDTLLQVKTCIKLCIINAIVLQTFVPLSAGLGLAFAAFGRRKRRSLEEERTRATDLLLDAAKVTLENNIQSFIRKFH